MFSIQRLTDKGWQTQQRELTLDEAKASVSVLSGQCQSVYRVVDQESFEMQCLWRHGTVLVDQSEALEPPIHQENQSAPSMTAKN